MTAYVTWKPFYSVEFPPLDAEHQQIIEVLNDLFAAVEDRPNHPAPMDLLKRLLRYTNTHFKHEEQVMWEHDYPRLAEHKALHDRLRQRTADLQSHASLVTARDLLQFVKQWWLEHIQEEDKGYVPYLAAPAHSRTPASPRL